MFFKMTTVCQSATIYKSNWAYLLNSVWAIITLQKVFPTCVEVTLLFMIIFFYSIISARDHFLVITTWTCIYSLTTKKMCKERVHFYSFLPIKLKHIFNSSLLVQCVCCLLLMQKLKIVLTLVQGTRNLRPILS